MDDAAIERLKAIAHPARFSILNALRAGESNVGEIEAATGITQPALSQQLSVLRHAGLVSTRREAKLVFYTLDGAVLAELAQVEERINRQLADWLAAGGEIRRSRAGEAIIDSRYWHCTLDGREVTIPCGGTHAASLAELGRVRVQLAPWEEGFILTTRVSP